MAHLVATEPDGPPFEHHGAQFIRVALHLRHRADESGTWIAPADLCAGRRYGLSHARRYQVALADEPERMATMLIAEIVAAKAPSAFAQLWADFRALVAQIADGLEPDAETIEQALGGNQKTLDDLREAVDLLQRRRELRRAVDEAPRLASERKRVEKEIAKADRAFKAAEAKYEAVAEPLHARLRQLKTLTSKAEEARRELWNTCGDEELRKRLDEVTGPLDELTRRLGATECNARNLRNEANAERDDARLAAREPNARAHTEEAARCEDEARQLESELPALRRKVASLEKQERAIREQMLEP